MMAALRWWWRMIFVAPAPDPRLREAIRQAKADRALRELLSEFRKED